MDVQMAEMHRDLMDVSEVNNVNRDVFVHSRELNVMEFYWHTSWSDVMKRRC